MSAYVITKRANLIAFAVSLAINVVSVLNGPWWIGPLATIAQATFIGGLMFGRYIERNDRRYMGMMPSARDLAKWDEYVSKVRPR